MLQHRLQVLAPAVLAFLLGPALRAQPPDADGGVSNPSLNRSGLLPLALGDFLAAHGGVTRLALKMELATAEEIAEEVRKQTGLEVVLDGSLRARGDREPRFSVEATGQTFWQAVREWNRPANRDSGRLGLSIDGSGSSRLRLRPWQPSDDGLLFGMGPCLMVLDDVQATRVRSLHFGAPRIEATGPGAPAAALRRNERSSLSVQGRVLVDPRLRMAVSRLLPEVESVLDEQNRALRIRGLTSDSAGSSDGYSASFNFEMPPEGARSIARIKGTLRLAVVSRREKWELDIAATPRAERKFQSEAGITTLLFESLTPRPGDIWSAKFVHTRTLIGPQRTFGGARVMAVGGDMVASSLLDAITFLNARGEKLSPGTASVNRRDATSLDLSFAFASRAQGPAAIPAAVVPVEAAATPAKIIIDLPLEWREVQIPFEIKDLPLP